MGDFYPISPVEIKMELDDLSFDWWVCAGWALELYAGSKIREHHDMDIAILRKDQFKLKEQLPQWEFRIAVNGILHEWGEHEISSSQHALWAKKRGQEKWMTEFLLNESTDSNWLFRKNTKIIYPLHKIGFTVNSIPVLQPIIPLLFKSAHCNKKDNIDFHAVIKTLDLKSKHILRDWIKLFQPECEWLKNL
jgi:hypothetical protein